jgi:four helix bundle protein
VYQVAFDAAMRVFQISAGWPKEERYSLTDQIRRSSRSICGNIAEGWQKRRYPASFANKLNDACAEAAETCVWLDFAAASGYLLPEDQVALSDAFRHVSRMLMRMIREADHWCGAPHDPSPS